MRDKNLDYRCLYVIDFGDKLKIGVTSDFDDRLRQHQYNTMQSVKRYHHTDTCTNYYELERMVVKRFSANAVFGKEWLNAPYTEVCSYVDDIYANHALHGENLIERDKKIVEMLDYHKQRMNAIIERMENHSDFQETCDFLLYAISQYTEIFAQLFDIIDDFAEDHQDGMIIDLRDTIYYGGMDDIWLSDSTPNHLKAVYIKQAIERLEKGNANYLAAAKRILEADEIKSLEIELRKSEEDYAKKLNDILTGVSHYE